MPQASLTPQQWWFLQQQLATVGPDVFTPTPGTGTTPGSAPLNQQDVTQAAQATGGGIEPAPLNQDVNVNVPHQAMNVPPGVYDPQVILNQYQPPAQDSATPTPTPSGYTPLAYDPYAGPSDVLFGNPSATPSPSGGQSPYDPNFQYGVGGSMSPYDPNAEYGAVTPTDQSQPWTEPAPLPGTDQTGVTYYPAGDGSYIPLDANGNPVQNQIPAPGGYPTAYFDPNVGFTGGPGDTAAPQATAVGGGAPEFGGPTPGWGIDPFQGGAFWSPPGGSIGGPLGTGSGGNMPFYGKFTLDQMAKSVQKGAQPWDYWSGGTMPGVLPVSQWGGATGPGSAEATGSPNQPHPTYGGPVSAQ